MVRNLGLLCGITFLFHPVIWAEETFNPLRHLGGNGPYFQGPDVFDIDPSAPPGCAFDQVAFVSRHGSRYPDPSAYQQWLDLHTKVCIASAFDTTDFVTSRYIQAAKFTTHAPELSFLQQWKPVLRNPGAEISQISIGGHQELYSMGGRYRWNYPDLYTENDPFVLWANRYQGTTSRVTDSARVFAQEFLGVNASAHGKVYVINQTDPRSIANSLAPSDLCPAYQDLSGGTSLTTWSNIYLPPIVARINSQLKGLVFNTSDASIFPYLCGFETQITGQRSPWCDVFMEQEILQYEYAQDLRYYYAFPTSPSAVGKGVMLPFMQALISRFIDGPNATYVSSNASAPDLALNPLIATFTNDGQINQLAAAIGVFDAQQPLPTDRVDSRRLFKASNFVTMKGTISFERLNCDEKSKFMRIKLNDVVYPVASCQSGPGRSCALTSYRDLINTKAASTGGFRRLCGLADNETSEETTFLQDLGLPFEYVITP